MTDEFRSGLFAAERRRYDAIERMLPTARAAVNALKDAKLDRTADALVEALFEFDAVEQELAEMISRDPLEVLKLIEKDEL